MQTNSDYLLLLRGTGWEKGASPEEMEKTLGRFVNWLEDLKAAGQLKGANPLGLEGKLVSGTQGRSVVDGPFAESKEAVGGYFLVSVADEDEAVAIAQGCPMLDHGGTMEVRPIAPACPLGAGVRGMPIEMAYA